MSRQAERESRRGRERAWQDPSLRIGDTERNEVADALSQHFSAGRLDDSELKERLDRAMSARTGADLVGLMTDLPPLGPTAPGAPPARATRAPRHVRPPRSGLWLVIGALLVFTALAHGPLWWPWWMAVRLPWVLVAGVVFLLWRRSRRRYHHAEP